MIRPVAWIVALLAISAPLTAQEPWSGVVVDSAGGAPLEQARIQVVGGPAVQTDRFGRFSFRVSTFPITIIVARIGYRPDTLAVADRPSGSLRIELVARPVRVAEIVVGGEGVRDPGLNDLGRWTVPVRSGVVPPALAPDLFRDLTAAPAVTQSTILSARPLVRGYDAGEATLLLDGFDLPNPYHIARAFSAVPVEAVERVGVVTAPLDVTIGGTSGAAVDIAGRVGQERGAGGGAALTPITLSAWAGGSGGGLRLFGAGRAATVGTIARIAGEQFAYGFQDGYASLLAIRNGAPWLRVTGFASHDAVEDSEGGDAMQWGVGLVGMRASLWRTGGQRLEVNASATRFDEIVDHLQMRGAIVDVRNEFSRVGGGVEWSSSGPTSRGVIGVTPAWRRIINKVDANGGSLVTADADVAVTELGAYGSWSQRFGAAQVDLGLRYDVAGSASALQPRVRIEVPLNARWTLGAAVGRSARLYHTISDPRSEPELVFYDLWLVAGRDGIPVANVDHAYLSATWRAGSLSIRGAAYGSLGSGVVEVRPETDQSLGGGALRTGDSRTAGVELQGGWSGVRRSMTLTYALTWSERDWGSGWTPWIQDRRHLVRLAAQTRLGAAWHVSALAEAMSAAPLTPVEYVTPGFPTYVYGAEGSARGSGTFRLDLGVEREIRGPWGSRGALMASVTNLTFGPVAPLAPEDASALIPGLEPPHTVRYVRAFEMPAIPTIGVRLEF